MITNTIHLLMPEVFVLGLSCLILLVDVLWRRRDARVIFLLTLATVIGGIILLLGVNPVVEQSLFAGNYVVDHFATVFKVSLLAILGLIFIYARVYLHDRNLLRTEFVVLLLLSTLGMMVLVSSSSFLTLYLGLELFVLPLYAVIAMEHKRTINIEAAIKYFVIGSVGAAVLLYGVSFIYGALGDFTFAALVNHQQSAVIFKLGLLLVLVGLGLELGIVPFHLWLPDVYQGSLTAVTMFIGTLPKIAILAVMYRVMVAVGGVGLNEWQSVLILLGIASIVYGNLAALVQTNLKRMLAYSTISHVGFIFLALATAISYGYLPALVYGLIYAFMALAVFAWLTVMSSRGVEIENLHDLAGLHQRAPWLAFALVLILLSLAGIPPLIGFYAKFLVLQALVAAGYNVLAAVALLFTVIGVFYYLRVVKVMYFEDAPDGAQSSSLEIAGRVSLDRILVFVNALALLGLGVFPAIALRYVMLALS